MKRMLVRLRLMSPDDTWGDVVFGLLLLWTFVGLAGVAFGLRIGWWDVLGIGLPQDPRNPAR